MQHISIVSELLKFINQTKQDNVNFAIAEGMLNHFKDIPSISIHELAELCYVSSASISRFVRQLGFSSYGEFKNQCRIVIDIDVDYSVKVTKADGKDLEPIFRRYTNNIKENLDYNLEHIDFEQLERVAKAIFEADEVAYFGFQFATLIGQHFQQKMAESNKFVRLGDTYEKQVEYANSMTPNSVAIIASLEGGFFYRSPEIFQMLKDKQAKIIAITMNQPSRVLQAVDELLICNKNNSDTEGRLSLLYMIELLLMYYYVNYKFQ